MTTSPVLSDKAVMAAALALARLTHEDADIESMRDDEKQALVNRAYVALAAAYEYLREDWQFQVDAAADLFVGREEALASIERCRALADEWRRDGRFIESGALDEAIKPSPCATCVHIFEQFGCCKTDAPATGIGGA